MFVLLGHVKYFFLVAKKNTWKYTETCETIKWSRETTKNISVSQWDKNAGQENQSKHFDSAMGEWSVENYVQCVLYASS